MQASNDQRRQIRMKFVVRLICINDEGSDLSHDYAAVVQEREFAQEETKAKEYFSAARNSVRRNRVPETRLQC